MTDCNVHELVLNKTVIADVFEKNEKENKTTSVYRLGIQLARN